MRYQNIVFDIGGVLLGYRWLDMLEDIGMSLEERQRFGELIFPDPIWLEFDYENISFEEVVERYQEKYPQYKDALRYFFDHAEKMPVWRTDVWEKVHELKEAGYGIYLLSNYSHVLLEKHTKDASFWNNIDGYLVSYMIHKIKPYPEIYQELFRRFNIEPGTAVFLDDRLENVEGGKACGMDGIYIESKEQLLNVLDEILGQGVSHLKK